MATKKRKSKSVRDNGSMINNWTDEALAIGCRSGRDWDAWYAKFGKDAKLPEPKSAKKTTKNTSKKPAKRTAKKPTNKYEMMRERQWRSLFYAKVNMEIINKSIKEIIHCSVGPKPQALNSLRNQNIIMLEERQMEKKKFKMENLPKEEQEIYKQMLKECEDAPISMKAVKGMVEELGELPSLVKDAMLF